MMSKLEDKANPNYNLIKINKELLEVDKKLLAEQIKTTAELVKICKYKEEQKRGDIAYRKKSTALSYVAINVALVALYFSIVDYSFPIANIFMELF